MEGYKLAELFSFFFLHSFFYFYSGLRLAVYDKTFVIRSIPDNMDVPLRNVLCGTQAWFRAEVVGSKSSGYVNVILTQGCSWSNNIWGNMNVQGFISFPCIWDRRPVPRLSKCPEHCFWLSTVGSSLCWACLFLELAWLWDWGHYT